MNKSKRTITKANFKFSMIGLTGGEELTFVPNESIKVLVVPINAWGNKKENMVEYQGKSYTLSGFVKEFHPNRNPSGAYQGSEFFKYDGKTLNEIRDIKEGKSKITIKRNIPSIVESNTTKILKKYNLEKDNLLRAIVGAIISNGGIANYTKDIYPYIEKYYSDIFEPYKDNYQGFRGLVNAKVQRYTKGMSNFGGTEIFIESRKGSGTYYVIGNNLELFEKDNIIYHFRKNRAQANMIVSDGKFIVKRGAVLCPEITSNFEIIKNKRDKLKEYINERGITTKDIRFKTPSGAGMFIYGATTNGWNDRIDENGNTLGKNLGH